MVDFSLLLPTRERPDWCGRALQSIAETAARPDRLEVVLYVDADDDSSRDIPNAGLRLVRLVRERAPMGAVTQACYGASQGRYLMLANDDVVFRSPAWDLAVLAAFARFPDDVALVWGNDLWTGLPAHPFISRAACEAMGGICPAAYRREYIDTHLHDVFRLLRKRGHERRVYLPYVCIEHVCRAAGKAPADETSRKRHRDEDEMTFVLYAEERRLTADRLARRLGHAVRNLIRRSA